MSIHDKHIELIVRQMTRRIGVQEPGDTDFLPGERVDAKVFRDTNRADGRGGQVRPAEGRPELMGITKASLATESWLSAASFQGDHPGAHRGRHRRPRPTTSIGPQGEHHHRQADPGRLGMMRVPRSSDIDAPDYQPMEFYLRDNRVIPPSGRQDPGTFSADAGGAVDAGGEV